MNHLCLYALQKFEGRNWVHVIAGCYAKIALKLIHEHDIEHWQFQKFFQGCIAWPNKKRGIVGKEERKEEGG